MQTKKFSKNDSGFVCQNCGRQVAPLGYTSRNHCPFCLCSKHVDINPGDRQNDCGGVMQPIGLEQSSKKGYVIVFKCTKCLKIGKNKAQDDDDFNLIASLSAKNNR